MKTNLTRLFCLFAATSVLSGTLVVSLSDRTPSTNETARIAENRAFTYGTVKQLSISAETNVTVAVDTLTGHGTSLGGSRSILSATEITSAGTNITVASGAVLGNDYLKLTTTWTSNANNKVRCNIITQD